ncbi:MAG: Grx4 family monothiol glutaredoxin [Deltaproteobacteria bacterium]|nr:Grx4 family monothiol glutaredoxin [Deltaproteobacteria bacterium]NND30686.1 Grx4 family monothiol glutaredoxin [Myxococcales bacterium]MBT8466367.1 Grx4 family monothiol glutaredoxin [Deltaproteobacteria bacterium]MBT8482730.1 Grx4 family monothiol glutaredoxin [Deltaproteobacteria bacterium]NNK08160.1 Grx4 family monothiol glutaredoxin [Myxococcales bacterium]
MDDTLRDRIQGIIDANEVVLFMKGNKNFPQCGFSATVVEVLRRSGAEFQDVNVLEDPSIRQGIKEFANWPTIPQLYVRGKFVGGSDIIREMYEKGELEALLSAKEN